MANILLLLFMGGYRENRMCDSLKAVFGGTAVDLEGLKPSILGLKFKKKSGTIGEGGRVSGPGEPVCVLEFRLEAGFFVESGTVIPCGFSAQYQ